MGLYLTIAFLGIGFFICFVNMIYRKIDSKNYSTWKNNSIFNSYKAWGLYATSIAIIIGLLFAMSFINMMAGFSSAGKQKDTYTQQQQQQQQEDSYDQQSDSTQ